MPSEFSFICFFVIVSLAYVAVLRLVKSTARQPSLPPGPKGIPFVGNIDIPGEYQWLYFSRLRQQYGDIVSLKVFGRLLIMISTRPLMHEIAIKRHENYADRPYFYSFEAAGWDKATALANGPAWKDHRRYMNRLFGTRQLMQRFYGVEMKEVRKFMRNILKDAEDLDHHTRHFAGAVILQMAYGFKAQEGTDPFIEKVDEAMAQFSDLLKLGTFMVDFLPWLRYLPDWLPGMGWKKTLQHYYQTTQEMKTVPFDTVERQLKAGNAAHSYVADLLGSEDFVPKQKEAIKDSASSLYAGGADTSVSQIHGFFLIMMIEQDVQGKAQAEIDEVVGRDRLPEYADRDRLPYVEAIVKEITRFHTVIPGGGSRHVMKDDILEGYFIPKGSVIMNNLWEMCHDPNMYPDPFKFKPERFLGAQPEFNPRDISFGFGRRVCPGQLMADATTWLCCVMTLALFDIKPTKGSPTEFSFAEGGSFTGDPISRPSPFKADIRPRSAKAEALIRSIDFEAD
ncbi:hypothetical protein EIP91_003683 [Steccherinum ochraceum]|uniref:Cytochrome P450 n=1 Tax=Steccherinum ochraceum TaxID=92696 RepID=A0A4V2MW32_9APHY|nr:hypothetical protein EIP91_003683 [Steccherinum ochraceum]